MTIKSIWPFAVAFAISVWPSIHAGQEQKPANVDAANSPEANAQAAYEAALKAVQEAQAAVVPLRAAMQKADAAYGSAREAAVAKRQKATDAKNLAGEQGAKELTQAEANVPAAAKTLTDAIEAKPALDQAVVDARAAAIPLREAYDAAEKEARAFEAAAKAAADAANKHALEAEAAVSQAAMSRQTLVDAKAALIRAQLGELEAVAEAKGAAQKLAEVEAQKKKVDDALAGANNRLAAATAAAAAAEKAAQEAAAKAKQLAAKAGAPDAEKKQAAADAAAKRKAADAAKAALAPARAALQGPQNWVNAAAKALAAAKAKKDQADATLATAKSNVPAATAALEAAEKAVVELPKVALAKQQVAAQVAAKRKVIADAAAALAQAQQAEQQAQAQVNAAAKALADVKAQKTPAPQKVAEAEAKKKSADEALAGVKKQVAAAAAAGQAAQDAAKELVQLDAAAKQAAADAAAKRQAANAAKATMAPVERKFEQAAMQANTAAQNLVQFESRKKSLEETLAKLKERIEAAKQSHLADEKAAVEAENAAVPLKEESAKARAAYEAALKVVDEKQALAEQAKAEIYRLAAAKRVPSIMESATPPKPAGRIDEVVFAKLKSLGIQPALCSDAVFVRRAYLDLTGTLPTADVARTFIQSPDENKRAALVDRLLDETTHADYWAMRWSDILRVKAEFPVKVWPNAAQAYHRWVWESIARNKPYDQFARELLTSSGSNFRVGPVNFYRAIQDRSPEGIAASVGLALMGTRVHAWPEERRAGMAAFFSQVGYKPTSEWKEEIVFWDPLNSVAVPGSTAVGIDAIAASVTATNQIPQGLAEPLSENGPLAAVFPDGTKVTIPPNRDPREVFADWLIRPENPWFARAIVNRTWAWAMGRGIVHDPDDIRPDNPPANPELLACLEKELVASRYNLKHLKRMIFTSTTYQFSSIPRHKTPEAVANFASYQLRRVEAEVLIDAVNGITGSSDLYTSAVPEPFTYIPQGTPAVSLADGSVTDTFLTLFGRSARATGTEDERINELASPQWLHMLNSGQIQNKLQSGPKLSALISSAGPPNEIAEKLYLTILSRLPTNEDLKAAEEHAKTGAAKGRDVWLDVAWALINSPEFLLRH